MRRARWFVLPLAIVFALLPGVPALAISDANLNVVASSTSPTLGNSINYNLTFTQGGSPSSLDVYAIITFPAASRDVTWSTTGTCTGDTFACGPNGDTLIVHWFQPISAAQVLHESIDLLALTTTPVVATVMWYYQGGSTNNLAGNITVTAVSNNNASVVVAASSVVLSRTVNFVVTVTKVTGTPVSGQSIIAFPSAFLTMAGDCPVTGRIAICPFSSVSTTAVYNFSSSVDTLYTGVFSTQGILTSLNNFDNTAADNVSTKNCTAVSALVITC
jgi:hypothetical protein